MGADFGFCASATDLVSFAKCSISRCDGLNITISKLGHHAICIPLALHATPHSDWNNIDPKNIADYLLFVRLCDEFDRMYMMHVMVHVPIK